jgi:hypothetical protein
VTADERPTRPDTANEEETAMSSIIVYGYSDHLIEVEGAIRQEFMAYIETTLLAFDDGTVLRIRYSDEGVWRIVPVMEGRGFDRIDQAPEDDEDNYSDRAYLRSDPDDPIRWVVCGGVWAKAEAVR